MLIVSFGIACLALSYWVNTVYGPFEVGSPGDEWVGALSTVGLVLVVLGAGSKMLGS